MLGAIHIIDALFPNLNVTDLQPSPYWIAVLLLSLQYGTVAGLIAAGCATLLYALGGLPEQLVEENHFSYLLRVWAMPILWIAVALVLGQFRLRQIERKQQLTDELEQRTSEANGLAAYTTRLEAYCRQLERQLTSTDPSRAGNLLDAIGGLQHDGASLSEAFDRLCRAALPDSSLSLYAVRAGEAELIGESGEPAVRSIGADSPLQAAVAEKRSMCVLNPADEKALAGTALAAVPIVHGDGGRTIGLLCLTRADGSVLREGVTERLAVLGRLLAPALGEPRIVVDNTAERGGTLIDAVQQSLVRGFSRLSWRSRTDTPDGAPDGPGEARPGTVPARPRKTNPTQ